MRSRELRRSRSSNEAESPCLVVHDFAGQYRGLLTLVSCGLYSFGSRSGSASIGLSQWSTLGLPAMAFFAGYLVISIFGRAKVQSLGQVDHSVRLGGLICFGGMLSAWVVFLAATAFLRS